MRGVFRFPGNACVWAGSSCPGAIKPLGSGARLPGFRSLLCHLWTGWPWEVTWPLRACFLICNMVSNDNTYFMGFSCGFNEFTYTRKLLAPCLVLGKCSVNLSHHSLGRWSRVPKWASVSPVNAFLNYLSLPPRLVPCFWGEEVESLCCTAGPDSFLNSLAEVLSPPGTTTSFSEKWAHLSGLAS